MVCIDIKKKIRVRESFPLGETFRDPMAQYRFSRDMTHTVRGSRIFYDGDTSKKKNKSTLPVWELKDKKAAVVV